LTPTQRSVTINKETNQRDNMTITNLDQVTNPELKAKLLKFIDHCNMGQSLWASILKASIENTYNVTLAIDKE
jgi:hypothetical protein